MGFYFIALDKHKKEIEKGTREGKREDFGSVKWILSLTVGVRFDFRISLK
jgi:hypothetical protein